MQSAGDWSLRDKCDFQKTRCTICVLDPVCAQKLCLQELPRQVFPKKKMIYAGLCMCSPVEIVELERPLQNIAMPRIWNTNNFLRTFKRKCLFPESSNNFVQLETNENLALPPLSMARCSQGSRGWAHLGFTKLSSPHWGLRKVEDESLGYIRWRACLLCANDGAWWRPVFGQHAFSFPHTFVIIITACSGKDVVER